MRAARLPQAEWSAFARDALEGMARRQKALPPKWFYDSEGSRLFQEITKLPEYYPTRTELAVLSAHAEAIAAFAGEDAVVVEYGAGSSEKAVRLLRGLHRPQAYVCLEIEPGAAAEAARGVAAALPNIRTRALVGDFTHLDQAPAPPPGNRLGFFPGSTIGNFEPLEATALLKSFGKHLGPEAKMIVGFDLQKPLDVLVPAYDDAAGVTAAFNKNVLARINRDLGGDFDLDAFTHEARWNAHDHRIEMHLVSRRAQTVHILGCEYAFAEGESIHTENSYKFSLARAEALAHGGGWRLAQTWTDPKGWFLLAGLERA